MARFRSSWDDDEYDWGRNGGGYDDDDGLPMFRNRKPKPVDQDPPGGGVHPNTGQPCDAGEGPGSGHYDSRGTCGFAPGFGPYRKKPGEPGDEIKRPSANDPAGLPYRPKYEFDPVPEFKAPKFTYEKFSRPDPKGISDDPSYQFRLNEGIKARDRSAAARGSLRSGGYMKAMEDYGQNMASQEYGNIYGRAVQDYMTNFGSARDTFDRNYQGARDEYSPIFAQWQTRTAAEQRAADIELQRMWDEWYYNHASARDQLEYTR